MLSPLASCIEEAAWRGGVSRPSGPMCRHPGVWERVAPVSGTSHWLACGSSSRASRTWLSGSAGPTSTWRRASRQRQSICSCLGPHSQGSREAPIPDPQRPQTVDLRVLHCTAFGSGCPSHLVSRRCSSVKGMLATPSSCAHAFATSCTDANCTDPAASSTAAFHASTLRRSSASFPGLRSSSSRARVHGHASQMSTCGWRLCRVCASIGPRYASTAPPPKMPGLNDEAAMPSRHGRRRMVPPDAGWPTHSARTPRTCLKKSSIFLSK